MVKEEGIFVWEPANRVSDRQQTSKHYAKGRRRTYKCALCSATVFIANINVAVFIGINSLKFTHVVNCAVVIVNEVS